MQIDPNGYDFDTSRKKHAIKQPPHEDHKSEQIHLYHCGNGNPPPGYANNSVSED